MAMAMPRPTLVLSTILFLVLPSTFCWAPKRTTEDIGYYYSPPEYIFQTETEPTCEELRAIWRMTKRTAQQSILTNEIHNPAAHFGYMTKTPSIVDVKPGRGVKTRHQSYGKVLIQPHQAPPGAAYDEVAKKLKSDVTRARSRPYYSSPSSKPTSVVYAPLDPDYDYATVRSNGYTSSNTGSHHLGKPRQDDFLGNYDKDTSEYGSYQMTKNDNSQTTLLACREIANKKCHRDNDCDCYDDVFTCVKGRCRNKTIHGKVTFNTWDDNNTHEWHKNTQPETPSGLRNKSKEAWRKSLHRTDRKKVGDHQDYYSKYKINRWT